MCVRSPQTCIGSRNELRNFQFNQPRESDVASPATHRFLRYRRGDPEGLTFAVWVPFRNDRVLRPRDLNLRDPSRIESGGYSAGLAATCERPILRLMEAIVVRASDRHRQLPSYLHSATIFFRLLTRSNKTETEASVRARISHCKIKKNWRTRHDSNV